MHKQIMLTGRLFLFLCFLPPLSVALAAGAGESSGGSSAAENPFTPKAYLIRYWKKQIRNNLPNPSTFLLSKASPMSAAESAAFSKIADQNALHLHLPSFCSSAHMLCFPDLSPSLEKHDEDVNFAVYSNKNFTNYGTRRPGGLDSFKNYSNGENLPVESFRRYGRDSAGHRDNFATYGPDGNVVDQGFDSYGGGATGGADEFKKYNEEVNVPNLRFSTYSAEGNARTSTFNSYTEETNSGNEDFRSYGNNGNAAPSEFASYGKGSNVIASNFNNYGENGNVANDSFTSYGFDSNVPTNTFKAYGANGNSGVDTFSSYRDQSNVGDDSFDSYAKNSQGGKVNFKNYGKSFNEGSDKFTGYGKGAEGQSVGFTTYGVNNTFKEYAKKGVTFTRYTNRSSATMASSASSGRTVNRWVEPGKFFRESMLKPGTLMPMPDIRDKMPQRSFLPRSISSKLPFSTSKLAELKRIFHASDNSTMELMISDTLAECERPPSRGETKRCAGSAEDMIDFAISVLGRNVVVRTTQSVTGSKQDVMIGTVNGINGGKVTSSVSCHQSMYPYLVYYCHSVPKVRVYEADLLNPKTKAKINHGVAICHIDTSSWGPTHGAFVALGSGPGKIEVCHWIFENDLTWTTAD